MKVRASWLALLLCATSAFSQTPAHKVAPVHLVIGSDEENYLRYLQSGGLIGEYPWSVRSFGPAELSRLAASPDSQPWSRRMEPAATGRLWARVLPLAARLGFNSAFPYGTNDRSVWAGRGFTYAAEGGIALSLGPLSAVLHPMAFRAENRAFTLHPNGETGRLIYADPQHSTLVDLPQRFGSEPYGRIDLGQSTVRVDLVGLVAGVSTANMAFGPMGNYQLLLGANGPGFPHVFAGSGRPLNVGIGRLHARAFWGTLDQSDYSPMEGSRHYSSRLEAGTKRFTTGLVGSFQPRGIPGLELGGARFFHMIWPREGVPRSYLTAAFGSVVKVDVPQLVGLTDDRGGTSNQLASVFARWVLPGNGFEMYGEYGHDDHNWDLRDFVQEPDHSRMYALGVRKVLSVDAAGLSGLRAELVNYQLPTLGRNRAEGAIYIHDLLRQGHTVMGQPLGADAGVGSGAASFVAWDKFSRSGKSTVSLTRTVRRERGTFYVDGVQQPHTSDVQMSLGIERTRFRSRVEVTTGATLVREFGRNFSTDAWNLNLLFGLRYHPGI